MCCSLASYLMFVLRCSVRFHIQVCLSFVHEAVIFFFLFFCMSGLSLCVFLFGNLPRVIFQVVGGFVELHLLNQLLQFDFALLCH